MPTDIAALWRRLDAALAKHAPAVLESLAGPAKPAAVEKLEAEFGAALPGSLKQSWAIHDGQDADALDSALFADFPFFGVAAVRAERKQLREVAKALGDLKEVDDFVAWHALVADGVGFVAGPVKARNYHPKWLPIGSFNGDVFRYLDFDPAPGGVVGQVIEVDPESVSWRVLAPSFEALLLAFVDALEGGQIDWDDPQSGSGALFAQDDAMPDYLVAHAPPDGAEDEAPTVPGALDGLKPGEMSELAVEVSRIIGTDVGKLGVRLDLAGGLQVWADASSDGTRGYKQITMRSRGLATLERLPGKKVAYAVRAFARRK